MSRCMKAAPSTVGSSVGAKSKPVKPKAKAVRKPKAPKSKKATA